MESIYNKTLQELQEYFEEKNDKKYRATQIYEWLYTKHINSFDEITNIKDNLLKEINKDYTLDTLKLVKVEEDEDVNKYLFELNDKEKVESVLMFHDYGNSICVSSQVGCNMGCRFCESGRRKKVRNLSSGEMTAQIVAIEKHTNIKITHVVIMGIGEPFDNYDNVVKFIETINNPKGLNIGARHITVSTCGIVPKIEAFSNLPYQVNLAISLHAPNDEIRDEIMPINKVYNLDTLIKAVKDYTLKTNRRVTFEYIMLEDVNDKEKHAKMLCKLLKGINCYINLIPYNETNNINYKRTKKDKILNFYDIIKKENMNVTIRREFGSKISAACGQLRSMKEG